MHEAPLQALPGRDLVAVEGEIDREIERLQREPIGERELQKAKNQLEAGFIFQQDSLFSQAMRLARYEMVLGWRAIDGYLPAIRAVSAADILRVAKRYLTPDNRTVAVLIPLPSTRAASRSPDSPAGEQVIR